MKKLLPIAILLILSESIWAQDVYFTSVNPAVFTYKRSDVHIESPQKYNNGAHLLSPDPDTYPWEERLENGMPNVLVDPHGNISVYFSSFIVFSPTPPSKVGVMAFTNTSSSFTAWNRPNAGLYWYNPNGSTADQKISSTYSSGYQNTNLVAVDIESLGIFDDGSTTAPIKLIYMPQREFQYKYLGAYELPRSFTSDGILAGFSDIKEHRIQNQKVFTFRNINADSHMNWLKVGDDFYFTSRVNGRRSALKEDETPPFSSDPRKRYRRSTITKVGSSIESKNVDFKVVLDYSDDRWEPYSMQPFRLPGYDSDMWFGLVTMYGSDEFPETAMKQRTELAYSCNGEDWAYLCPGTPFLSNGASSTADDFGCINIATPVYNTKLHTGRNPLDPFFFYASSRIGHTEGRNPGISLAMSHYGKIAGLTSEASNVFYSPSPLTLPGLLVEDMPHLSIKNSFDINARYYPQIIGDITEDPSGKHMSEINSYVVVRVMAYDANNQHGLGDLLGGSFGSSVFGTQQISNDFIAIPYIDSHGVDGNTKQMLINYIKKYSTGHPTEIVSFKDYPNIPVVFEASVKDAVFYGMKFQAGKQGNASILPGRVRDYRATNIWSYEPESPAVHVEDFSGADVIPNALPPTRLPSGSVAIQVSPVNSQSDQTILKMEGDNLNFISFEYLQNGSFSYRLVKEGEEYVNLNIAPPAGSSFSSKDCDLVVEVVKNADRKFEQEFDEETTIMRVSCSELNFEQIVNQEVIMNFRREVPTAVDTCYARGFAYLPFASFVGNMDKVLVGASTESGQDQFLGTIYHVEVADKLPEDGAAAPRIMATIEPKKNKRESYE